MTLLLCLSQYNPVKVGSWGQEKEWDGKGETQKIDA
jgi:hypothetical protein